MSEVAALRAGRREWIGLAMLTLPAMLVIIDLTLLHLAVPALSADLKPTSSQLLWIVDIYGFLITMGTLGDRIGRHKLLMIGASAFGIASLLAAFSRSAEMLIVARALLGIAGATLAPSTLARRDRVCPRIRRPHASVGTGRRHHSQSRPAREGRGGFGDL